jgi:transcriptional regulator with XRE-family HTH domain
MSAHDPVGPQVRIRPYRVAVAGMTLEQLAERIAEHGVPVSVPHLSRVERGQENPSERLLRAWSLALGLNPLDVWMPGPGRGGTGGTEERGETGLTQVA